VTDTGLLALQVRTTNKAFWRNPASAFFTFAFPLMFLVIFTALLGSGTVEVARGVEIQQDSYYVAAMSAFAVITATYTNLAISIAFTRDAGILKRTRGAPLPAGIYLGARVTHAILVSVLLVVITTAFGVAFYQADVPSGSLFWEHLTTVVVGAMAFSALGLATTAIVPNADAAAAVVNAIILPRRPRAKGKDYEKIWNREQNESPLKTITRPQAAKLRPSVAAIDSSIVVDWGMRYGNPSTPSVIRKLKDSQNRPIWMPSYDEGIRGALQQVAVHVLARRRYQQTGRRTRSANSRKRA